MSESVYKRIDRAVYQAERALVVGALIVMAIVVFLDVVHRSFSGETSKLAIVLSKIGGWFGAELTPGTPSFARLDAASPYLLAIIFTALGYFGIRTAKRSKPVPPLPALGIAIAGVLVAYGLIRLLLDLMPNGLTWSQDLALVLTLWVGFVGASMCTYENRHLRVEAAQRMLPEKLRPAVTFISGLFTTTVCLGLVWLSLRYVEFHRQEYLTTDGKGGLFPGMDLPKYIGFSALPLSFSFMAVRYLVKSLGALRGELDVPLDPVEAAGGVPPERGAVQSEIATEARPLHTGEEQEQPSAIDTMTSKAHMEVEDSAPQPQSRVPTDVHSAVPALSGSTGVAPEQVEDPDRTNEEEEPPIPLAPTDRDGRDHQHTAGELVSKDNDNNDDEERP